MKKENDQEAEEKSRSGSWREVTVRKLKRGHTQEAEDLWRSQSWRLVKISGLKISEDLRTEEFGIFSNWRLTDIRMTDNSKTLWDEYLKESWIRRQMNVRKIGIGENQNAEDSWDLESRRWEREIERHQWDQTMNEHLFNLVLGF